MSAVFSDDHTKLINPPDLYGQNTRLFNVKVDGAHSTPGTQLPPCFKAFTFCF